MGVRTRSAALPDCSLVRQKDFFMATWLGSEGFRYLDAARSARAA